MNHKILYNPYENAWNLMKQMVEEYSRKKRYLTVREINYIIRFCEKGLSLFDALNQDDTNCS
ncbi:hypothetical protein [Thermovenabulum sp.]|uniref:hypothetical protein n=1 Tax=Thermovenabulum sp. TaxID=3100335 RepID=UPI003C79CCFC